VTASEKAPILVPVDFEAGSMAALQKAIELAQHTDTTVIALHAFALPPYVYKGIGANLLERIRLQSREAAVRPLQELAVPGLVSTVLREGQPVPQILEAIQEHRPSMVIMGSHGHRGTDRVMLGSVAETVVRKAQVPVMVVHAEQPQSATGVVLCAIDLEEDARPALELAQRYARSVEGTVEVLHVYALPGYAYPRFDRQLAVQLEAEIRRTAGRQLASLEKELGPFRTHLMAGKPGKAIVDLAAKLRPAAIVMATQGRGGIGRAFLGSVTEWVMRRSPFPVLTTHPGRADARVQEPLSRKSA
jgi:nucleotide-binding universal stress UspA family protein